MENPNFLKNKYNLHNAPETEAAVKRAEARTRLRKDSDGQAGEKVPQNPEARIQNYLDRFKEILEREDPRERERGIEALKQVLHKKFVIKPENIPQSHYNLQGEIAVREGRTQDLLDAGVKIEKIKITDKDGKEAEKRNFIFPEEIKKQYQQAVVSNQQKSMDKWVDYLSLDDAQYPDWAKYWAFRSMLEMGKLRKEEDANGKERARFAKRTKDTVASFPPLNPRALALAIGTLRDRLAEKAKPKKDREPIENKSVKLNKEEFQNLASTENFAKIYAQFLIEMPEYSTEGLQETRGKWVKYSQGSAPDELVKSLDGYPLEWCTAEYDTAQTQLNGGDFYVYYSINEDGEPVIPRLAIRMEGGRIAEPPRGIAPDQNMDPYIIPVLEEKLKDFGQEGEAFKKRSEDMKKLTEIENKTKKGEELTKDDLAFLYEINSPIEGFGYRRDPRIEELRSQRNKDEDMPIVFECQPEQIARDTNEINKNTKAYVGKLEKGIFNLIQKYNIEHIYTSFPEGKISQFEFELGGQSAEELLSELEAREQLAENKRGKIHIYGEAKSMLKNEKEFIALKTKEHVKFIKLTVNDLGFPNYATTDEIYKKAEEIGLELCPPETGPRLRLDYEKIFKREQPRGEYNYIAMKQIIDSGGSPRVFRVDRSGVGESCLRAYLAGPDSRWVSGGRFVFRSRSAKSAEAENRASKPGA